MSVQNRIVLVLLCGCTAMPLAQADVCQRGSISRIKVVELPDATLSFGICDQAGQKCMPIGSADSYGRDRLEELRREEEAKSAPTHIGLTDSLSSLTLLTGVIALNPTGIAKSQNPPTAHKENAEILAPQYLSAAGTCIYVPSVFKFYQILGRVLNASPDQCVADGATAKGAEQAQASSSCGATGEYEHKTNAD